MKNNKIRKLDQHQQQQQQQQQHQSGEKLGMTSISDIPSPILTDILARLPIKFIFNCMSVCKPWLHLLRDDPAFAKFHFSLSRSTSLLIHCTYSNNLSKLLYFFELDTAGSTNDVSDFDTTAVTDTSSVISDFDATNGAVLLPELETSTVFGRNRGLSIVNSCNGLLCLRGPADTYPLVIYNPITGEYSVLPKPDSSMFPRFEEDFMYGDISQLGDLVGGLGFSRESNQYKVLVIIVENDSMHPKRLEQDCRKVALIYTLGSGQWRRVGNAPQLDCRWWRPTFSNGALHWYVSEEVILAFDFEDEKFHALPTHLSSFNDDAELQQQLVYDDLAKEAVLQYVEKLKFKLGVVRGCLCLCGSSDLLPLALWVMEKYGVKESWRQVYENNPIMHDNRRWRWEFASYQPIGYLNNGDLLVFFPGKGLISYNGLKFKCVNIRYQSRGLANYYAIAHNPSFVSLTEVMGDTMDVLNVKSRRAWKNERRISLVKADLNEFIPIES